VTLSCGLFFVLPQDRIAPKIIRLMPSKGHDVARSPRREGLPRKVAQAAAKRSWENRDLPNWRDRVDDLLKGEQIFVKDLRQWNSIYVAAKRKGVPTLRFKVGSSRFAVVAEGIYDRKVEFIRMATLILLGRASSPDSWRPGKGWECVWNIARSKKRRAELLSLALPPLPFDEASSSRSIYCVDLMAKYNILCLFLFAVFATFDSTYGQTCFSDKQRPNM